MCLCQCTCRALFFFDRSRTRFAFPGGAAAFVGAEHVAPQSNPGRGVAAAVQTGSGEIFAPWPAVEAELHGHRHVHRLHW